MGYDRDRGWERTKSFYENPERRALIQTVSIGEIPGPEERPLNRWDFPSDLKPYLDGKIEALLSYWEERKDLDDDALPMIHPWFGIAEHSSFIGGEVEFSEDTSWHKHLLTDWAMLDDLELREDNLEFLSERKTVIRYEARGLEDAGRVAQLVRENLG